MRLYTRGEHALIQPYVCSHIPLYKHICPPGVVNSWDRESFLTDVSGKPSFDPLPTKIRNNFMIANYGASQAIDNDDGSSWYHTTNNLFYSADGFKMDCAWIPLSFSLSRPRSLSFSRTCTRTHTHECMHTYTHTRYTNGRSVLGTSLTSVFTTPPAHLEYAQTEAMTRCTRATSTWFCRTMGKTV